MFLLQGHLFFFHAENKTINRELVSQNGPQRLQKKAVEKHFRAALNFIALIVSHKIRQMLAKFSGVEV